MAVMSSDITGGQHATEAGGHGNSQQLQWRYLLSNFFSQRKTG